MNSTIEELVDELMVEEWNSSTIYDGYYNECQPSKCSYSYQTRNDLIYIITTVIGLVGGLITVLKLIVPRVVQLIVCCIQRCTVKRTTVTIFYSITNLLTTYEAPLRSYIQSRINVLENALQEEVRNRDNVDITLLEQQFDRESENFIAGVTRRVHQIRDEIKTYRPTNTQESDYEMQMIQYRQFLHSSSISMNRITDYIDLMFEKIRSIVKNIIEWMADNTRTIVDILEQVCETFKFIGTFLNQLEHLFKA
ncbi:unnamed protein product [Adineta steineri]|uniref:Uncharacterized protein n=1 Tax=Adineta steineri TaxID=433720 RepID=A0A818RGX9_9BILA|nr:unnamed protein product [Adineta steineri]